MNKASIKKIYGIELEDAERILDCAERIVEDEWTLDTTTIALCEVYNCGKLASSACETAKNDIEFYRDALEKATATINALECELQGSRKKVEELSSQCKCHREALEKSTAMVKGLNDELSIAKEELKRNLQGGGKHIPFYMVYVDKQRGPEYQHETLESAETEAQRLVSSFGKKAYVLQPVEKFVPEINAKPAEMDVTDEPLPF